MKERRLLRMALKALNEMPNTKLHDGTTYSLCSEIESTLNMRPKRVRPEPKFNKEAFLNDDGNHCPFCGETPDHFKYEHEFQMVETQGLLQMSCTECKGKWTEAYELTDVQPQNKEGVM